MNQDRWARCTDGVADVLRRGAWYRVVEDGVNGQVILEVRGRLMQFSSADLTIREAAPSTWSVVVRTGALRATLGIGRGREVVTMYAVCPHCAERQDMPPGQHQPPQLECHRCHRVSPVDWSETC
jgi:hypothetical protein